MRRGKARAVAPAAHGRADHRRERHGNEDLSGLPARGLSSELSGHPDPHPQRHEPDGPRLSARGAGRHRLCQRAEGQGRLFHPPLLRYPPDLRRRAELRL